MTDRYLDTLRRYWGYDDFRGVQREIIESVGRGEDTLGLMPTGGGKSITFQVPTLSLERGLCLVVTPLIALMKDQVASLRRKGIRAAAIYSGMGTEEVITTLETCIFGGYRFLYVSPERLASPLFLKKIAHAEVSLIAVDEAHCISQWGYDFRPSYLQVGALRDIIPGAPILALTASATPVVADDIQRQLRFGRPNVFRMSFDRPNLVYVVRHVDSTDQELLHILKSTEGSAIVYCRSRKGVAEIAKMLNAEGIAATFYHAGLDAAVRDKRQGDWTGGSARVMVATNAFGMGIDKADVRLVVHIGAPDSLEAYYQEAGRAGRDGQTSYAVLLCDNNNSRTLRSHVSAYFPPRETIAQIYENICCYLQLAVDDGEGVRREFDINIFCMTFRHYPASVVAALRLLEQAGYLAYDEEAERSSRLCFLMRRDDLYKLSGLGQKGDAILNNLLRNYGGVFTDECFISESLIAELSGATPHEVYEFLRALAKRSVIKYVPQRQCPVIEFKRRRVDTPRLHIPKEVYEDRREIYSRRVEAVIAYTETDDCRGNHLLRYFGERPLRHCRHCDVCKTNDTRFHARQQVRDAILSLFGDNKTIELSALHTLPFTLENITDALNSLLSDEIVAQDGPTLILD